MPEQVLSGSAPLLRIPRPGIIMRKLRARHVPAPSDQAEDVREVLKAYGLEPLQPVCVLEGSYRNETWTAVTRAGKKFLKRYKTSLKHDTILHEHSILDHLEQAGFPSTRLVKDRSGETIVSYAGRFYGLQDFLEGYVPFGGYFYFPSRQAWFMTTAGRALARLHNTLRGFTPRGSALSGIRADGGRFYDLDWYMERLAESRAGTPGSPAAEQPAIQAALSRADWLESNLRAADSALKDLSPPCGLVHGDYGPYNLMVRWGSPLVVLDFELSRNDYLLADVISYLSSGACTAQGINLRCAAMFLNGYQSENPLPESEKRALPVVWQYMALRRVITAWASYLKEPRPAHLNDITRRLDRLDWLETKPDIFL